MNELGDHAGVMKPDHITLLARGLETSARYYGALLPLLGFAKLEDHVWRTADGFYVQLLAARAETRPYERYGAGMNHLGFAAPSAEVVEGVGSAMAAAGFEVPDIQDLGGVIALFMKDPDGARFEISYCPPGRSVVDRRQVRHAGG